MLLGFEAEDLGCEVLDGVEEFSVAIGEERSVGAVEFDGEFRGWGRCGVCFAAGVDGSVIDRAVVG